jgi:hypothetical protein
MNNLRLWIGVLALVAFGAGVATGLLTSVRLNPRQVRPGPFADYQLLLQQTFDLSPARAQALSQVMGLYARDVESVRERYLAKAGSDMQKELERYGLQYRDQIRNHVLPPDQRERFDRLSEEGPLPNRP